MTYRGKSASVLDAALATSQTWATKRGEQHRSFPGQNSSSSASSLAFGGPPKPSPASSGAAAMPTFGNLPAGYKPAHVRAREEAAAQAAAAAGGGGGRGRGLGPGLDGPVSADALAEALARSNIGGGAGMGSEMRRVPSGESVRTIASVRPGAEGGGGGGGPFPTGPRPVFEMKPRGEQQGAGLGIEQ